ncbi:MAG: hypothetical protein ABH845_04635 [Candidatus Omnitrophota bacterium]
MRLSKNTSIPPEGAGCPSGEALWQYLCGALEGEEEKSIASHLFSCWVCLGALLLAQEARRGLRFDPLHIPPAGWCAKAASLAAGKRTRAAGKKYLWLFLSLLCIGLSFFSPNYFMQCLILGILFGFKWVFDTAASRSLIIMYESLKGRGTGEEMPKRIGRRMGKESGINQEK